MIALSVKQKGKDTLFFVNVASICTAGKDVKVLMNNGTDVTVGLDTESAAMDTLSKIQHAFLNLENFIVEFDVDEFGKGTISIRSKEELQ